MSDTYYTISNLEGRFVKFQFDAASRVTLYEKIPVFLEKGIPLYEVLSKLTEKYKKINKSDIRSIIIDEILFEMQTGKSFSQSLSKWVPAGESMLIHAGEQSGALAQAFQGALFSAESSSKIRSTLTSGMIYPIALFFALAGLLAFFSFSIIPALAEILPVENWPDISKSLYDVAMFVQNSGIYVLVGIVVVFGLMIYSLPRLTGRLRDILDYFFVYKIYRTLESSSFLIALGILMEAGVPVADAIAEMQKRASPYTNLYFSDMLLQLSIGKDIGTALNNGLIDKEPGIDVEIYSETGSIQDGVKDIGARSVNYAISSVEASTAIARNIMISGIALLIGWVYYGQYLVTKTIGDVANFN